jgi:hypothetical protein
MAETGNYSREIANYSRKIASPKLPPTNWFAFVCAQVEVEVEVEVNEGPSKYVLVLVIEIGFSVLFSDLLYTTTNTTKVRVKEESEANTFQFCSISSVYSTYRPKSSIEDEALPALPSLN